MSFDKLIYEASVSYFIGQCRLVSAYYNSSYHLAPWISGKGARLFFLVPVFWHLVEHAGD